MGLLVFVAKREVDTELAVVATFFAGDTGAVVEEGLNVFLAPEDAASADAGLRRLSKLR